MNRRERVWAAMSNDPIWGKKDFWARKTGLPENTVGPILSMAVRGGACEAEKNPYSRAWIYRLHADVKTMEEFLDAIRYAERGSRSGVRTLPEKKPVPSKPSCELTITVMIEDHMFEMNTATARSLRDHLNSLFGE